MKFTREQLEKIISEAPEGATHYSNKVYVIFNNGDTEWCQVWFAGIWGKNYYIHNAYSLIDLQKQLDEMKMNNKKLTVEQARDFGVVFVEGDLIDRKNSKDDPLRNSESEWINNGGVLHDNEVKSLICRNHTTDEMPCDGDMVIEVYTKETYMVAYKAELLNWSDDSQDDFVSKWRPHLSSLIERANKMNDSQDMQSVDSESVEPKEGEWWLCTRRSSEIVAFYFGGEYFQESKVDTYRMDAAKPIERLYTQAELDAADEQLVNSEEFKNGDVCEHINGEKYIFVGKVKGDIFDCVVISNSGSIALSLINELSKPPTKEQKQAQIDEKNGELFHCIVDNEFASQAKWNDLNENEKCAYINISKQIDFDGKLSA